MKDLLEEAIESWGFTRSGVLEEARAVPDASYGFRPADGARSVSELLRHILESGLMMVGELTDPEGDFTRRTAPEHIAHHAAHLPGDPTPEELRDLLASTHEEGAARLRATGEIAMLQEIRRFDGALGTRLAWMAHGIDHESYHRGQLALYVRLTGRVPALTRKIHGNAAE